MTDALDNDDETEADEEAGLRVQASQEHRGKRLDAVLASINEDDGLSRSRITSLIKAGHCQISGKAETNPARKLKGHEAIVLELPEAEDPTPQPENIPLEILFEDDALIVINKPAGMVVHPGAGNPTGTLVNALLYHCGDTLSGIGGVKRPGLVHRLDKDTSGVMVVAKTDAAHQHLSAQFADHGRTNDLERIYTAFVWGVPKSNFTIDAPLGRDRANRLKMAVSKRPDAREAVTHGRRLATYGDPDAPSLAKIECQLETGRTHQIRVHMAHIGHGIIGDPDYGRGGRTRANRFEEPAHSALLDFPRQALQARTLQFTHPKTAQIMRFEAPLDEDLQTLESLLDLTNADLNTQA
ncbi:MAG: RluA family pseudouridine synthase [Hyphomicrobiales bacterium]